MNNIITNYCLYYIPKNNEGGLNDVLMIYFGENEAIQERQLKDEIITFYHGSHLIGFALLNFSNHAKIKINGTIFLPNEFLINVINSVLINAKKNVTLGCKEHSGFVVGKIIDKKESGRSFVYDVDIKDEVIKVESTFDIDLNLEVCVAKTDTYLLPARMIKQYETKDKDIIKGRICTYDDLQMPVENSFLPLLMQEDELEVGQDFFLMEERDNDGDRA